MKGIAIFICAPSGTGKTTILSEVLKQRTDCKLGISMTTRPKRPLEKDGQDYHFITENKFKEMIEKNQFIEFTQTFDNYYGTPKHYFDFIDSGENIIFDITVDGVNAFYQKYPEKIRNFVSIILVPPSYEELKRRLSFRNTESKEKQEERLSKALSTLSAWSNFDYWIPCNKVEQAAIELSCIIEKEKQKLHRLDFPPFLQLIEDFK